MANAEDAPPPEFRVLQLKAPEPVTFVPEEWSAYRKQVNRWVRISEAKQLFEQDKSKGKPHSKSLWFRISEAKQLFEQDKSKGKPHSKSFWFRISEAKQLFEQDKSKGKPHSKSLWFRISEAMQLFEQDKSKGKLHSKSLWFRISEAKQLFEQKTNPKGSPIQNLCVVVTATDLAIVDGSSDKSEEKSRLANNGRRRQTQEFKHLCPNPADAPASGGTTAASGSTGFEYLKVSLRAGDPFTEKKNKKKSVLCQRGGIVYSNYLKKSASGSTGSEYFKKSLRAGDPSTVKIHKISAQCKGRA
jgi:hypothetical protein